MRHSWVSIRAARTRSSGKRCRKKIECQNDMPECAILSPAVRQARCGALCKLRHRFAPPYSMPLIMRIAVLDDDPNQTDLVCKILTASGHVCHPFNSGKEMLHQLRRDSVDMLILDWQVPDVSGADVVRWTRDKLPANLPV